MDRALQNPSIAQLIFQHIPAISLAPLLRVSPIFFHAVVACLYRKFGYEHYHRLMKICTSKNWPGIISRFPHAARVGDTIFTIFPRSVLGRKPQISFNYYYYYEALEPGKSGLPQWPESIPGEWAMTRLVCLTVRVNNGYDGHTEEGRTAMERDLVARVKECQGPLTSLTVWNGVPGVYLEEMLREVQANGGGLPVKIVLGSCDEGVFGVLELLAPTLESFGVETSPDMVVNDNENPAARGYL
ncbi:hypothetical protein IAT38_001913 [Cryptococcus sp. DSM 104549]